MDTHIDTPGLPNIEVDQRFAQSEEMIQLITSVPVPVKKGSANNFVDSPFIDAISMVEIPRKFNILTMKIFDSITEPDDNVTQYK